MAAVSATAEWCGSCHGANFLSFNESNMSLVFSEERHKSAGSTNAWLLG